MKLEFIKNKVYYNIFDRSFKGSSGIYSKHRTQDATKLAIIKQNIHNIESEYSPNKLFILKQTHGNKIVSVDSDTKMETEGDGSITKEKNIALSILTADCVPVLLASEDGEIIGAAHCGWRSAKADIISNLAKKMRSRGANKIKTIIGPSIAQKSYEIDEGFYRDFTQGKKEYESLFINSKKADHYMFDLPGYVIKKLEQENIELHLHINDDTYEHKSKYPSCRRSYHKGEKHSQSILSTIVIR